MWLRDAHAPGKLDLANPAVLAERPDSVTNKRARVGVALGVHVLNISTGYSNVKASALNQEEAAVVDALRAGDPVQVMTAVAAAMGRMRR